MAEEHEEERSQAQRADLTFCFFPHLKEFLVIDTRPELPNGPQLQTFSTDEVYNEEFYHGLVESFARFLRHRDYPLLMLMGLSTNVEQMLRERGMETLLAALNKRTSVARPPQIAILMFAGPLLNAEEHQVHNILAKVFPSGTADTALADTTKRVTGLLAQERAQGQREQQERLRRGLMEGDGGFLTIWERPPE
ncbi:MAG: hypothetical protein EXR48_02855 [Dehalococcoidia bacterium]|nr:hypothetical protein [Dehalococcoidia bacterium]